ESKDDPVDSDVSLMTYLNNLICLFLPQVLSRKLFFQAEEDDDDADVDANDDDSSAEAKSDTKKDVDETEEVSHVGIGFFLL
ncbi:hypothetical protein U1Q18_041774, partial [Sarracenia purpurea var. burkii]